LAQDYQVCLNIKVFIYCLRYYSRFQSHNGDLNFVVPSLGSRLSGSAGSAAQYPGWREADQWQTQMHNQMAWQGNLRTTSQRLFRSFQLHD